VKAFLERFVVYPSEHALVAHMLWIAHTWLMDAWESTPRIAFLSPEPGSGKSRALEVTEPLVPRPVHAVNTTPAYLFRKVSDPDGLPTILYDEIDTVFGEKANGNEDIRGMLNAGHRKGAVGGRCVVRGKVVETEELPAYCAVMLAGLDDLPDTIMSRSIVIRMRRRAPSEPVEPWRHRINTPEAHKTHGRCSALLGSRSSWPLTTATTVTACVAPCSTLGGAAVGLAVAGGAAGTGAADGGGAGAEAAEMADCRCCQGRQASAPPATTKVTASRAAASSHRLGPRLAARLAAAR
jgi:hypothetical protein